MGGFLRIKATLPGFSLLLVEIGLAGHKSYEPLLS